MWFKILEFIWKASPKEGENVAQSEDAAEEARGIASTDAIRPSLHREKPCRSSENAERLEGLNEQYEESRERQPPTREKQHRVAYAIREYGEIVVFGSAVLIILVLGERNMFSPQIRYQQEPIVSHYTVIRPTKLTHRQGNIGQWSPIAGTILAILGSAYLLLAEAVEEEKLDPGGTGTIRIAARLFMKFGDGFGNIARKIFDDSDFRRGRATAYPEVPGEENRNPGLSDTRSIYSPSLRRNSSGSGRSNLSRQRSGPAESTNARSPVAKRRDTLEVPSSPGHHGSLQGSLSRCVSETGPVITRTESPSTPTIVVSPSPVYVPDRRPKFRRNTTGSSVRPGASNPEPG